MQQKTTQLANKLAKLGLNVSKDKTKVMHINNTVYDRIVLLDGDLLEYVESSKYLGSVIEKDRGADKDMKTRIGKARSEFLTLKPLWQSKIMSQSTKPRIFNSNVKTILFYGWETWKTTKVTTHRLQTFVNKCLASDPYLLSIGPAKSKIRNCGIRQGKKERSCKFYAANGVESATHCVNQKIISQIKH